MLNAHSYQMHCCNVYCCVLFLLVVVHRVYGPKGPVLGKKKAKKSQAASSVNTVLDMQCLHVLSKRAMPASGGSLPSVAVMMPCTMPYVHVVTSINKLTLETCTSQACHWENWLLEEVLNSQRVSNLHFTDPAVMGTDLHHD